MLTFSDKVHDYIPPEKGRKHALGLVRRILQIPDMQAPAVQKHDVVGIHVFDPRELHLPMMGRVRFRNPETGSERIVNTSSRSWRRKFAENVRMVQQAREELCRENRLDLMSISTSDNLVLPLRRFFELRKKRRRR